MGQSGAVPWSKTQQAGIRQDRDPSQKTQVVQHFGPDAEDVEHISERYVDEQLPGAVQVPRCEEPRPRYSCVADIRHTQYVERHFVT